MQIHSNQHHGGAPRYLSDRSPLPPATAPTGLLAPSSITTVITGILLGIVIATAALGYGGLLGEQEGPTSSPQRPGVVEGPTSGVGY